MPRVLHNPDRSVFLTDGVIAIAVTLLALDLKPDLPHHASSRDLAHFLATHASEYLAFVLAFWLIARFWMLHHDVMRGVREFDTDTMWANMLFLFAVTCLPITTFIQGNFDSALAITLFGANLTVCGIAIGVIGDLTRRRGLTTEPESYVEQVGRRWRGATTAAVPAIVAGLAWVVPHGHAEWFFLLFFAGDVPARIAVRRARRLTSRTAAAG
jgi:uncharacterized membrane protein